jgi:hypothetical protein
MRVRLVQNLHLDGAIRLAGSVVEGHELCESWITRGIAVLDAAPIESAVLEELADPAEALDEALAALPPEPVEPPPVAVEMAAPVVTSRRQRHR